jgi:adenosylmethionine-8-amino-7-oxononanoate aminotransferase
MTTTTRDLHQLRAWDGRHTLHPWEAMEVHGTSDRTFLEGASGIFVTDSEGRRLIDGPGGMWCVQIGYGRVELA